MGTCPFHKPADIDFMDPVVQENWFDAYEVLHRDAPVYFMPGMGLYVITKYDDLDRILKDGEAFQTKYDDGSSHPLIRYPASRRLYETEGFPRLMPLSTNPPLHRAFRGMIDPFFTAQAVRKREGLIRSVVNSLIDVWIDKGEIEFVRDFAEPLPMAIIAEALGFPRVDLPRLKAWSGAWVAPFAGGLSEAEEVASVKLHIEFQHYIHETALQKRANPTDDVISHLAVSDFKDPTTGETRKLTDAEIVGISDHLLTGGNETTTFALTSGMWLLFRYPEVYAELRADRSKIRQFVEEALRVESPTQGLNRHAAVDAEFHGVKIPKGSAMHVRYGAGNRDPERFPEPEKPDLKRRNAASHLAFGTGEHVCPGAALSRFEQNVAWEILLSRLDNFRPVEEKNDYSHVRGVWIRALKELNIRFDKVA